MDLDDLDMLTESVMVVQKGGQPTDVTFTFAGPGHERGVAQTARIGREAMQRKKLMQQAQVNGKKWVAPEENFLEENIAYVIERMIGWSGLTQGGEPWPFTPENARKLLSDPGRVYMVTQAMDFLLDDNSFTKRSPKA